LLAQTLYILVVQLCKITSTPCFTCFTALTSAVCYYALICYFAVSKLANS